jgi:hypothetical protein
MALARRLVHTDAGLSSVQGVFAFVKRNLSEALRRKKAPSGVRAAGKGAAALVAAQRWRDPERDRAPNRVDWIDQPYAVHQVLSGKWLVGNPMRHAGENVSPAPGGDSRPVPFLG